jgi:CRISPR-associated protein Cmr2
LGAIGNYTKNIDKFSECLGFFSREASKMVVEYGGTPIFAGGDDVLFLAPVRHKDKDDKNIFDLLESLNRLFIDIFKGNEAICKLEIKEEIEEDGKKKEVMVKPVDKLAQSFGVSITYYKHPLQEALKTTTDLLFITAKSHIENNDKRLKKNAIAFKVQKHSGQYFDACINMKGQFYEQFQKLLNEYKREDSRYLSSVMFTLREQQKVLRLIAEDKQKIANFFDKNFDEKPHDENRGLINAIRDLVHTQFKENPSDEDFKVCKKTDTKDKKLEYNMERIFACLKFIHFLRAKDHQND